MPGDIAYVSEPQGSSQSLGGGQKGKGGIPRKGTTRAKVWGLKGHLEVRGQGWGGGKADSGREWGGQGASKPCDNI